MKELTLSNFTAEQSVNAASQRQVNYAAALATHQQILEQMQERSAALRRHAKFCFDRGDYFAWLKSLIPLVSHSLTFTPSLPQMEPPSRDEILWNVGGDGESCVKDALKQCLSDEWTMVSGYRNRNGEIDQLLVGPSGVLAIEVKNVSGVVSCNGEFWWRDKYDKYGNLVQRGVPLRDNGGRSPCEQLNASASLLEAFLTRRVGLAQVGRVVILPNPSARIGQIRDCRVDSVFKVESITLAKVQRLASFGLGFATTDEVVCLIARDHVFHENRSGGKRIRHHSHPVATRAASA
jgi:hypothetical protein